jgi:hypothetical protein
MNKREKDKKNKEMNAKNALEGIEGSGGDVSNSIDLVMAANTQESQKHNTNNYELLVDSNDIAKRGALIMPNIYIEITHNKIGETTVMNTTNGKGGESETMTNQNRIEC